MTNRQREVWALLANGLTDKEIARDLRISYHTAKTHVARIRAELRVRSRVEMAVRYVRQELA